MADSFNYEVLKVNLIGDDPHHGAPYASINELIEQSTTDPVTGLLNRRGFVERWNDATEQTNRNIIRGFKLLNLDLDTFKPVNDNLGHTTGDKVLKLAGEALKSLIRKSDVVGRTGGDEFGILIFDSDNDDTEFIDSFEARFKVTLSELLLQNGLSQDEHVRNVGVSVGLITPNRNESFEDAWNRSDKLMYARKEDKKVARK